MGLCPSISQEGFPMTNLSHGWTSDNLFFILVCELSCLDDFSYLLVLSKYLTLEWIWVGIRNVKIFIAPVIGGARL